MQSPGWHSMSLSQSPAIEGQPPSICWQHDNASSIIVASTFNMLWKNCLFSQKCFHILKIEFSEQSFGIFLVLISFFGSVGFAVDKIRSEYYNIIFYQFYFWMLFLVSYSSIYSRLHLMRQQQEIGPARSFDFLHCNFRICARPSPHLIFPWSLQLVSQELRSSIGWQKASGNLFMIRISHRSFRSGFWDWDWTTKKEDMMKATLTQIIRTLSP